MRGGWGLRRDGAGVRFPARDAWRKGGRGRSYRACLVVLGVRGSAAAGTPHWGDLPAGPLAQQVPRCAEDARALMLCVPGRQQATNACDARTHRVARGLLWI